MVLSVLFLVGATAAAVVGMLLYRKFLAPPGGVLSGMESADGIFSAAAAGLTVLLAFVIFTVFDSYQHARTGAGTEAVATQQLYRRQATSTSRNATPCVATSSATPTPSSATSGRT